MENQATMKSWLPEPRAELSDLAAPCAGQYSLDRCIIFRYKRVSNTSQETLGSDAVTLPQRVSEICGPKVLLLKSLFRLHGPPSSPCPRRPPLPVKHSWRYSKRTSSRGSLTVCPFHRGFVSSTILGSFISTSEQRPWHFWRMLFVASNLHSVFFPCEVFLMFLFFYKIVIPLVHAHYRT